MQFLINFYVAGVDYNSGPYNVTFPIGSTNASFDIAIIDDGVLEDDEMFNISITSITNGHIVGTPAVATVTIIDTTGKLFLCIITQKMYISITILVQRSTRIMPPLSSITALMCTYV